MGNGYNNQLHPQSVYQRSTFLPMLCRVSSRDVRISQCKNRSSCFSKEPSSPKVSCMGQVKINNKVLSFLTQLRLNSDTTRTNTTPSKTSVKYTKPKKLYATKNLITGNTTASTTNSTDRNTSDVTACRRSRSYNSSRDQMKRNIFAEKPLKKSGDCNNGFLQVNISELDPPLPVIKKVCQPGTGRDEVNLWKRRFCGDALKNLQIEQIHLPDNNHLPPTTARW